MVRDESARHEPDPARATVDRDARSAAGSSQRNRGRAQPRLDLAALIDLLPDGVFITDRTGRIRQVNAAAGRIYRIDPAGLVGRSVLTLTPEWARASYAQILETFAASGRSQFQDGPPIRGTGLRCDGTEVDVEVTLGSLQQAGEPGPGVVIAVRDVGEHVRLEREAKISGYLRAAVDASSDAVLAISPEGRVLAANRRFCEMWKLPEDRITTGGPSPVRLPEFLDQLSDEAEFWRRVNDTKQRPLERAHVSVQLKDGRFIEGEAAPISDAAGRYLGRVWFMRDDTQRRVAEAQRRELLDRLQLARLTQGFLLQASDAMVRASSFAETLERLAAVAVPTLGDICLIDVIGDNGELIRMAAAHADPARQPLVDELRRRYPPEAAGEHPGAASILDGQSRWSEELTDDFLRATTRDERHLDIVRELGFTSYMTVALVAEGKVLGSITVVSAGSGRRYGPADLDLAEELAGRVALVVAKVRRYEQEMLTSHTLQSSLLPAALPHVPGLSLAVRYLPGTRDAEVGGDFYDAVETSSGTLAVAVGDVAGHDITAAATMGQLRSAYRALVRRSDGPSGVLRLLQDSWDVLGADRIATAVFGEVDPREGTVRLASAGHLRPCQVGPEGAADLPVEPSAPFGAPVTRVREWTGTLPRGTALIMFTDGLVEDRHRDITDGTERLLRVAAAAGTTEPEALADRVLDELAGTNRSDDVALLIVRRD